MADPSDDEEKPIRRDHTVHTSTGGTYCFSSDVSSSGKNSTLQTPILQSFEPTSSEIYNLTSRSMEMMTMIGFQSPNNHLDQGMFFDKPGNNINPSSSKGNNDQFYQQQHGLSTGNSDHTTNEPLYNMVSRNNSIRPLHGYGNRSSIVMDDASLRCVFPCEANERPGQGLSLSLSSSNPSSIGLQSFELRRRDDLDLMRFGSSSSSSRTANDVQHLQQSSDFQIIKNSKYLGPAQEFLNELCSLGTKQTAGKMKAQENNEDWENEKSIKKQELHSIDLVELQKRKIKLLHMLEEVDRRYKHYHNHMKAMVSSFEAVAGNGSATVYSALASKAMSKHFRCLRDGIMSQIKATKKVMGDKDIGETSRSRVRDQKPLQQMSVMETHPWRRRRGLPERPVSILRAWLFEHFLHPYPSDADKHMLALKTGLTRSQVSNWYINARVRLWKPMVEEMYLDELKEEANHKNNVAVSSSNPNLDHGDRNQSSRNDSDQKPNHDQLFPVDHSTFIPTIINSNNIPGKVNNNEHDHSSYGDMQLGFSPYHGGISGGGVSLTLGLHHHQNVITRGGDHESLLPLFSSSSQSPIFYNPRLYGDHGQNMPYSLVNDSSDQGQALPLRDLIGTQLLHELDA